MTTRRYTCEFKAYQKRSGPRLLDVTYKSIVKNKSDGDPMAVVFACKHAAVVGSTVELSASRNRARASPEHYM